jgi:hypothetical protein
MVAQDDTGVGSFQWAVGSGQWAKIVLAADCCPLSAYNYRLRRILARR